MTKNKYLYIKFLGVLFIGLSIGFLIGGKLHEHDFPKVFIQDRIIGRYKFINPLLECNVSQGTIDSTKVNFHKNLLKFLNNIKEENKYKDISILYRDLNNGPTFGINELEGYIPASLLKVPVMMAYLQWSEDDPAILKNKILFKEEHKLPEGGIQFITPKNPLEIGKEYLVAELIERSIVYSDNQAVALLVKNIDQKKIDDVFEMLGVDASVVRRENGKLSVKEYAAFFRILFNSSYLNRENSEKALEILSKTDFKGGLVAGVPNGITVAHKFGESGVLQGDRQLHDCGIVYYPQHPYLLCIMSSGDKIEDLEKVIADVSRFVFEEVSREYEKQ